MRHVVLAATFVGLLGATSGCDDAGDASSTSIAAPGSTAPRDAVGPSETRTLDSAPATSTAERTPTVWRRGARNNGAGEEALIAGVLLYDLSHDCFVIDHGGVRYPVVWPAGTEPLDDPIGVRLGNGTEIQAGTRITGGGGYANVGQLYGIPRECVPTTGEVAVFNPNDVPTVEHVAAPSAGTDPAFVRGGGCGDVFFWTSTADDSLAITFEMDQTRRPSTSPTSFEFTVPDPSIQMQLVRGRHLSTGFCTDLYGSAHRIVSTEPVTSATGELELGALGACGGHGQLRLSEVILTDGRNVRDIIIEALEIGCSAG